MGVASAIQGSLMDRSGGDAAMTDFRIPLGSASVMGQTTRQSIGR